MTGCNRCTSGTSRETCSVIERIYAVCQEALSVLARKTIVLVSAQSPRRRETQLLSNSCHRGSGSTTCTAAVQQVLATA
jgi:hypothetical protein